MSFELDQVMSFVGFSRRSGLMLRLFLSMSMAVAGTPAPASDIGDTSTSQQQPSAESREQKDRTPQTEATGAMPSIPSATPSLCDTLAMTAMTNDLPVDFFTRLIWQESRFKPDAVSPKGAQGIAQFMPATARSSGLEDPFNPLEAIGKSGQLLQGLRREFGNLGLAAAAYNAGPGRVRDWLGGIRPLPQETRAYVWLVTGRSAEAWAANRTEQIGMPAAEPVPCNLSATASIPPQPDTPKPEIVKPWGVEVVGGPTPAKALASYREWQPKYAAIVADRELHVVIRGIIGQMGAARVRVGEDTQDGARKLCAALKAAGAYCDVMRN